MHSLPKTKDLLLLHSFLSKGTNMYVYLVSFNNPTDKSAFIEQYVLKE